MRKSARGPACDGRASQGQSPALTQGERRRVLPQDQWEVLIKDHHEGFIDWETYQASQAKIAQNIRPVAHHSCFRVSRWLRGLVWLRDGREDGGVRGLPVTA